MSVLRTGPAIDRIKVVVADPVPVVTTVCIFCGYEFEGDDRYGCPNCNAEGLDGTAWDADEDDLDE